MNSFPLVSVIIPTFNRAQLLGATIESVLRQSYSNYEILVLDDGSTDETAQRVASLSGPIRYLPFPHHGDLTFMRNQGVMAATGALVAFLDHDDLWVPEKLARQVALFEADAALGMVYTNMRFLFENGALSEPVLLPYQKDERRVLGNMLRTGFVHPSTVMVRQSLVARLQGFDTRFGSQNDYHFFLRAALKTPTQCVPDPLVHIRKTQHSMSRTNPIPQFMDLAQAIIALRKEERLPFYLHLLSRRTISRLITHVGLDRRKQGAYREARQLFGEALRWNPFQLRAWQEWGRTRVHDGS